MEIVDRIKGILTKDEDITFAYLYGSFAWGITHKASDIDIAVYLKEGNMKFYLKKDNELLSNTALVSSKIDLRILNVMPLVLKFKVVSEGKLLFSKDEQKRVDFETEVYNRYFELKPFLDEEKRLISEKIKAY